MKAILCIVDSEIVKTKVVALPTFATVEDRFCALIRSAVIEI